MRPLSADLKCSQVLYFSFQRNKYTASWLPVWSRWKKSPWPEADEELTCVLGACNIVLHKCIWGFTAVMRRGGRQSAAVDGTGLC